MLGLGGTVCEVTRECSVELGRTNHPRGLHSSTTDVDNITSRTDASLETLPIVESPMLDAKVKASAAG